jgi:hypothetical protein
MTLAHVIQSGSSSEAAGQFGVASSDDRFEAEAEAAARAINESGPMPRLTNAPAGYIRRKAATPPKKHEEATPAPEIVSETAVETPANRARRRLGVGEEVTLRFKGKMPVGWAPE